jgi:hypothetical protein
MVMSIIDSAGGHGGKSPATELSRARDAQVWYTKIKRARGFKMATVTIEVESDQDGRDLENFYNRLQDARRFKGDSFWTEEMTENEKETADVALDEYNTSRYFLQRWVENRMEEGL